MVKSSSSNSPSSYLDTMISSDCCFLSSCIDLDDVDLRSSLLHLVGIQKNKNDNDGNTNVNQNEQGEYEIAINTHHDQLYTSVRANTDRKYNNSQRDFHHDRSRLSNTNNHKKKNSKPKRRMFGINRNSSNANTQTISNTATDTIPKLNYSFSSKSKFSKSKPQQQVLHNAPPPVIALSRSSFSTNSNSSGSSSLEATEFEHSHHHTTSTSIPYQKSIRFNHQHDSTNIYDDYHHNHDDEEECNVNCYTVRENYYEGRHELLINSLFEDAKKRQEDLLLHEQQQQQEGESLNDQYHTPPRNNHKHAKPTSATTSQLLSDNKSIASKTSKYSSRTLNSNKSNTSELLTPSSHKFQKSLRTNMMNIRGVIGIQRFHSHRNTKNKSNGRRLGMGRKRTKNHYFRRLKRNHSDFTKSTSKNHEQQHHGYHSLRHPSDFSACSGSMTTSSPYSHPSSTSSPTNPSLSLSHITPNVQSFLDINVKLQKDSGKGIPIGQSISANGRDNALKKLNDKMDILAEVDRDDKWSKASLTRVPAKNMTDYWEKNDCYHRSKDGKWKSKVEKYQQQQRLQQKGYVETRSMLAVKLGFVTLKYGILVHWNVNTGLAELILLRKSCPESFMKGSLSLQSSNGVSGGDDDDDDGKKKSAWNKKRHFNNRIDGKDCDVDDSSLHATPSFVSFSSENSGDNDSLGIEHVGSANF